MVENLVQSPFKHSMAEKTAKWCHYLVISKRAHLDSQYYSYHKVKVCSIYLSKSSVYTIKN